MRWIELQAYSDYHDEIKRLFVFNQSFHYAKINKTWQATVTMYEGC